MIAVVVVCDTRGCQEVGPTGADSVVAWAAARRAARRHGWRCELATDLCPAHAVPPLDEAVR